VNRDLFCTVSSLTLFTMQLISVFSRTRAVFH